MPFHVHLSRYRRAILSVPLAAASLATALQAADLESIKISDVYRPPVLKDAGAIKDHVGKLVVLQGPMHENGHFVLGVEVRPDASLAGKQVYVVGTLIEDQTPPDKVSPRAERGWEISQYVLLKDVGGALAIARPVEPAPKNLVNVQVNVRPNYPGPVTVLSLRRGETKTIQLCWDFPTGRAERVFITAEPELSREQRADQSTSANRFEQAGIAAEFDEEASYEVQKVLHETGKYTGRVKPGSPDRSITARVFHVTAAADAELGGQSLFVHIASGTVVNGSPQGVLPAGEFRVLVSE